MLPLCLSDFDIHILKHMCTQQHIHKCTSVCCLFFRAFLAKNWCVLKGYVLIHEGVKWHIKYIFYICNLCLVRDKFGLIGFVLLVITQ